MKPHLPYDQQLARLSERGLTYSDRAQALGVLKRVGYYPFSAYSYPFRAPATEADRRAGRKRAGHFMPESKFEDALALYDFDTKLRICMLQALHEIELSLAVKVGYTLGRRAPDGHLRTEHLDSQLCARVRRGGLTEHQLWRQRYDKLCRAAKDEEYVKHHNEIYRGEIPIWVATGFMDFGCLVRLYSLMDRSDRRKIAAEFGLGGDGSRALHRWLVALNILRNQCSHLGRVWNRSTVDVPPKVPANVVPSRLAHVNGLDNDARRKLYLLAALTAHLVQVIHPEGNWVRGTFVTVMNEFPSIERISPEQTMGFPEGWRDLELWRRA